MSHSPNSMCPHAMQVSRIEQETPDVFSIHLTTADNFPYQPGQYAMVSIDNAPNLTRAYTLSSSPEISPYITLTVRRIDEGVGSNWLTRNINCGDTLWLSDAMGEFCCQHDTDKPFLMLAAGCGVTPIMSMTRWLLEKDSASDITVIYHVKTRDDIIFANQWQAFVNANHPNFKLVIATTQEQLDHYEFGRLNQAMIEKHVANIAERIVMTCGPVDYMNQVETICTALAIDKEHFHKEQFFSENHDCLLDNDAQGEAKITIKSIGAQITAPIGATLLDVLEDNDAPVFAACRSGMCGACKTKIVAGEYETSSTVTLSQEDVDAGYVLACSCQIKGDLVVE